jgi:hypothetical protein
VREGDDGADFHIRAFQELGGQLGVARSCLSVSVGCNSE